MTTAKPTHKSESGNNDAQSSSLTSDVHILGLGRSSSGHRFIKLSLGGPRKPEILRIDNLSSNRKPFFEQLNQADFHLISPQAQNEFINRIQDARGKTSFNVAEEAGLFDDCFILPDCTIPKKPHDLEVCLNDIPPDVLARYSTAGTLEGWQELAAFGHGNSRMMFAFALSFVGPLSKIWPRQPMAFQLVGKLGGSGKSTIGVVSSASWGWDPDVNRAEQYGFGDSWNTTVNYLEKLSRGYNQTFLFLDETNVSDRPAQKSVDILEAVMKLDGGTGKGRLNSTDPRYKWSVPVLSTSNKSVPEMIKARTRDKNEQLDVSVFCDRLIDIPAPRGQTAMFEELHGFENVKKLAVHLKKLASMHHGEAAREFIRRVLQRRSSDEAELVFFLDARAGEYERAAKRRIKSTFRDLTRVHGKFATGYAVGCLAIQEKILPVRGKELLEAVLTCEEDHVRLVDDEMGGGFLQQPSDIEILRDYIRENQHRFVDLNKDTLAVGHDHNSCPGYIGEHNGRSEYLFSDAKLREIFGRRNILEVKKELHRRNLISSSSAGEEIRYVTKRAIGGQRVWVVSISSDIMKIGP
jgi:hypothetical protein